MDRLKESLKKLVVSDKGIADLAKKVFADSNMILDIGSGDESLGLLTLKTIMKDSGKKIESLDNDPKAGADITASADEVPRNDEDYDGIFASHVLEHLDEPEKALEEWKRLLKKEGRLLIVVPFKEMKQKHHKIVFTSPNQLKELAEKCGFRKIRVEQRLWLKCFQSFFGRLMKKGDLILVCKK